mmetsp:Transcript_183081/g.445692  ORF Transcript_183081/g.445692 Transcript_183081/m.445692 type:complete len:327 (-) Transcript_183081:76-1056(-)
MYFGTPSPAGKFYKGLSTDTPVNHDLHWRDRVVKENHMVKALNKRRAKDVPDADMFIKRPWTEEEDQQLVAAVRKHGPNNWQVVCRDRTFIEMIGNHTQEDIKSRWRLVERNRRTRRERLPPSGFKQATLGASGGTQKMGVMNQLKMKKTLQEETEQRRTLASQIERERRARLEAEKQAAVQMKERKRLAEKLAEFEDLVKTATMKGSKSAPVLPPVHPGGSAPGHRWAGGGAGGSGDDAASALTRGSRRSHGSRRSRGSRRSHGSRSEYTESVYTRGSRRPETHRSTARSVASKLSTSSAAIEASRETRERARQRLDALREDREE